MNPAGLLVSQYSRVGALKALRSPERTLVSSDSAWKRCIELVQQLSYQPNAGGLTAAVFQDLAIILRVQDQGGRDLEDIYTLQKSFHVALSLSPSLLDEFGKNGVPLAFEEAFLPDGRDTVDEERLIYLWRTSFCLIALLSIAPPKILDLFTGATKLLVGLASCYDSLMSLGHEASRIALRAKVNIIDTVHILFEHCSSRPWAILDMLFPILDLPTTSPPPSSATVVPFGNRTLLGDYEATYALSSKLSSDDVGDPRYDFVRAQLRSLIGRPFASSSDISPDAAGALRVLLPLVAVSVAKPSEPPVSNKGKGKATEPVTPDDVDADMEAVDAAISQILDILPDENPAFLQACLHHPAFHGPDAAEKLLSALLEGGPLPDGLDRLRDGATHDSSRVSEEPRTDLVGSRRNAFEDDPMDYSRLRVGKNRSQNADSVLRDKSFATDMKAEILRRVRELAEEEEEAEREARAGVLGRATTSRTVTVAYEDELSDDDMEAATGIKIGGNDGEAIDGEEEGVGKSIAALETILELAYIQDPKIFDRDSATRRSRQRADLMAETGWDDEQIEGWRIMLERNPWKDRILAKHEFSGNKPLASPAADGENTAGKGKGRGQPGQTQRVPHRGVSSSRGGGSGRGRGGSPSDTNVARNRARKDKAGNQQRRRGHDKKMARGGAAPA